VGRVGVKLVAAPDAPPWGEVLVRIASDRISSDWTRATSKFTCLSREHQVCSAQPRDDPGRVRARSTKLATSGVDGQRGQTASRQLAGSRIARYLASAEDEADTAADAARKLRQRARSSRSGGRDPHPGKDPL
jgi:hypothetical protein